MEHLGRSGDVRLCVRDQLTGGPGAEERQRQLAVTVDQACAERPLHAEPGHAGEIPADHDPACPDDPDGHDGTGAPRDGAPAHPLMEGWLQDAVGHQAEDDRGGHGRSRVDGRPEHADRERDRVRADVRPHDGHTASRHA